MWAFVHMASVLLEANIMKTAIVLAVVVVALALIPVVLSIGALVLVPLALVVLPIGLIAAVAALPLWLMSAARDSKPGAVPEATIASPQAVVTAPTT